MAGKTMDNMRNKVRLMRDARLSRQYNAVQNQI